MSVVTHLAGTFDPKKGQHCFICGLQMLEDPIQESASWPDGGMVLRDGTTWFNVETYTQKDLNELWPAAEPCTSSPDVEWSG